jgi:hypothetical protein
MDAAASVSTPISLWWIALLALLALIAAREVGYLLRKHREKSRPGAEIESEEGFSMTSVMGLLALLIGFTFSLSLQRHEARRELVMNEANALGTAWLRMQLLEDGERMKLAHLFKQYVDVRVRWGLAASVDDEHRAHRQSERLQQQLWTETVAAVKPLGASTLAPLVIASTNEYMDASEQRFALREAHLPPQLLRFLAAYALISAAMIGFHKGRHRLVTTVLFVLLTLAGTLILDLDLPRRGSVLVSQQPMLDLQATMAKTRQ